MIKVNRHRCTITCRFLIEPSIWFMLALMMMFKMTLIVVDAPTAVEAAAPALPAETAIASFIWFGMLLRMS